MSSGSGNVFEIRRGDIRSADAQSLILALNAELSARYPEAGACHFKLDADEVAEGRGAFLVVYVDGERPVGCSAIRRLDEQAAEIKRMYVRPEARGKGIAMTMLAALEAEGRRLGVRRVVLETGVRQGEALGLYAKAGFARIPAFGEYIAKPLSICMAKEIGSQGSNP